MKMKNIILTLLVGLSFSGCSIDSALTPQPERTAFYYLKLDATAVSSEQETQRAVMIGAARVSEMLNSKQIVSMKGDGRLHYSYENVWGEDLEEGIRKLLRSELSGQLQSTQIGIKGRTLEFEEYQEVGYYIEELGGELGGEVVLRVSWWTSFEDDKKLYNSVFNTTATADSYGAYVTAIRTVLVEWSREVAESLRRN